jgi:alanine racemase
MISSSAILEVNLKKLISNYKYLSSLSKINFTGATVKANAYGLGDIIIIKTLYKEGCRHFFVANIFEAINIRKSFKHGYIYVLNGVKKDDLEKIKQKKNIIPIINSLEYLNKIKSYKINIKFGIHIDTGINRLGIPVNDLKQIKISKNIKIILIMSHLASADEKKNLYNIKQTLSFKRITNLFFGLTKKSLSNSLGMTLGDEFHYDITRPGIALYGGHYNTKLRNKIKPVVKLKAEILQIKKLSKNQYVGYNQTFYSKRNMTIAILGIGYADGISRILSNIGYAYFKKFKFKIIGRVSMDTVTIDITNATKFVKVGMLVDLINYENDIEKLAKKCGTISNEILTSISTRVKRVYKK